jgi:hypothetical protein
MLRVVQSANDMDKVNWRLSFEDHKKAIKVFEIK